MDPLADAAIHCLMEHQRQPGEDTFTELQRLYRRAPLSAQQRDALERFFHHVDTPLWVDWDAVIRGQRQLAMQALPVSASFLVGGLIESYTAPGIARILTETVNLADTTSRRIFETGQMVFDCAVEGSLTPGRMGHRTLLKVRLMHAFVRFHALRRGITNPINQAEMAFTLGMFRVGVLNGLELDWVLFIPQETARDYHHLWRTAGYFLGLDQHLLPSTVEEAFRLQAKLTSHLHNPDGNSRQLAHAVIGALQAKPPFLLSRRASTPSVVKYSANWLISLAFLPVNDGTMRSGDLPHRFASGILQARSDRIRRGFQSAGLTFGSWALGAWSERTSG